MSIADEKIRRVENNRTLGYNRDGFIVAKMSGLEDYEHLDW
jgi:hypothetical protein